MRWATRTVFVDDPDVVRPDQQVLDLSGPLYDGLYEYLRRSAIDGRDPS
jgi:hypothetical protein